MSAPGMSRGEGWVLCCLCFKLHTAPYPDLEVDPVDGKLWDNCKVCSPDWPDTGSTS